MLNKFSDCMHMVDSFFLLHFYKVKKKNNRIVTNCLILSNNSVIFYIKKKSFSVNFIPSMRKYILVNTDIFKLHKSDFVSILNITHSLS